MRISLFLSLVVALPVVACVTQSEDSASSSDSEVHIGHPPVDAGTTSADAATTSDASATTDDGPQQLQACTTSLGSQLTGGSHGRLDGYLVSIVPAHSHQCHGDSGHVHLQIQMAGSRYDVAVNVDQVGIGEVDAPLSSPWSEGWHASASLDYVNDLGLHASNFQTMDESTAQSKVLAELATANHVSIFATKYSLSGIHLVHRSRSGGGLDGAIVINPTSATPHYVLFRFPDQSF